MNKRRTMFDRLRKPRSAQELLVARLTFLVVVTLLLDLAFALVFLLVERGVAGTEVSNYGDALFWATSQLTTVSSSIRNPLTPAGRFVAVGMDLLAVGFVSVLISTITSHLHIVSLPKVKHFRKRDEDPAAG